MLDSFTQRRYTSMLFELRAEHRDLDAAIDLFIRNRPEDQMGITRLKKRKLLVKDQIAILERQLTPDIRA